MSFLTPLFFRSVPVLPERQCQKGMVIMKHRSIAIKVLVLLIVLSSLISAAACTATGGGEGTKGTSGTVGTDVTSTPETEPPYPLDIVDYKGKSFRVTLLSASDEREFFVADGANGDDVDVALYTRNSIVEDRYKIKIEPVYINGEGLFGHTNTIADVILSDNDAYDLVTSYAFAAGPLVMNSCLFDWKQQKHNDLEASWWIKSINDKFEIDGHLYTAVGDTNTYTLIYTYAMMFNRTAGDNEKITSDVFAAVRDGSWTIDKFNTIVSNIYNDIDGENGRTAGDYYGFQGECLTNLDNYNFAFNIPMMDNREAGEAGIRFVYDGEKLHDAIDKIIRLYWNNSGSYVEGDNVDAFVNGRSVFSTMLLNDCFSTMRNMRDDYTILPYPKFNEDQKEYLTGMMDNYMVIGIPISERDTDFVSLVTEALNYEAERILYPAYYDDALQNKYRRDDETIEMLNILMNGRTADFGTLFQNNLDNISCWFRWIVDSKENTSASYVAERKDYIEMLTAAIVTKYREGALG